MQGVEPVRRPGVSGFFNNDLFETEVIVAHATVFLVGPYHKKALLAALAESLSVDNTGFAPVLHMRHDLRREELAIGIAEHILLFSEVSG